MLTRRKFLKLAITAAIAPTAFAGVMAPKPAYGGTYAVFEDFSLSEYKENPITIWVPGKVVIGNVWVNGKKLRTWEYKIQRC